MPKTVFSGTPWACFGFFLPKVVSPCVTSLRNGRKVNAQALPFKVPINKKTSPRLFRPHSTIFSLFCPFCFFLWSMETKVGRNGALQKLSVMPGITILCKNLEKWGGSIFAAHSLKSDL